MKKVLWILVLLLPYYLNAQIDFGIKAGINYNSNGDLNLSGGFLLLPNVSEVLLNSNSNFNSEGEFGFLVGVYANFDFNKFYLQSELLYTQTKSSYDQNPDFRLSYLEIPALLGYNLIDNLSIYGGPSLQLIIDEKFSNRFDFNFDKKINPALNIGAKFKVKKISIDFRYLTGISKNVAEYLDDIPSDGIGYTIETRSNQFLISLGYQLN